MGWGNFTSNQLKAIIDTWIPPDAQAAKYRMQNLGYLGYLGFLGLLGVKLRNPKLYLFYGFLCFLPFLFSLGKERTSLEIGDKAVTNAKAGPGESSAWRAHLT